MGRLNQLDRKHLRLAAESELRNLEGWLLPMLKSIGLSLAFYLGFLAVALFLGGALAFLASN